ncbi:MAG TPA: hypothetical protein VD794_13195 [Flavisolibacter sp.]|nr:hypothetical protein [Flavisolibacter sp.]
MLLSILNSDEIGFDQLLVAIMLLNALVIVVLTFKPGLHRRLVQWIWPKRSKHY